MSKQYNKLADSSDALMIKEAIEKLSNVSLSPDIGDSIAELAKELREANVERPSYQFKVQRDHNGVMIGIQATPFP